MSYYYSSGGGGAAPGPGPTEPSYQVGAITNETIVNSNVGNYLYFNRNSSGAPVTNGQIIQFSFNIETGDLYGDPNTTYALVTGARVYIYKGNLLGSSIVGYVDIPYFGDHDGSPPGIPGYGTFVCTINANTLTIGSDIEAINWIAGNTLLPSQLYLLRVPYRSNEYNASNNNSTSYSSFTTLPSAPVVPAVVHPIVDNGSRGISGVVNYLITTTTTGATLTSNYYYPSPPTIGDSPNIVGFKYRKIGTTTWTTVTSTTTFTSFGISNVVNTTTSIIGLTIATQYEYLSYVIDNNGSIYYSANSGLVTNINSAKRTPFTTLPATITSWTDPNSNTNGHWYQLYNDWELIQNSDSVNKVAPFLRVREYEASTGSPLKHNNTTQEFSIFYFFNKKFTKDKNYQFRTIVENFYTYKGNLITSGKNSKFKIKTPWGEVFDLSITTPYFPLTTLPSNFSKVLNLYLYTNINSFDPIVTNITKPKPIELIESKSNPQNPITYTANTYFNGNTAVANNTSNSLLDVNISDLDWIIQGYAPFNISSYSGTGPLTINNDEVIPVFLSGEAIAGKGWHFLENKGSFIWFDKYNQTDTVENSSNLPIGGDINNYYYGKTSEEKYLVNNFISKYISYQTFNISFDYTNETNFKLSMYVGGLLPSFESSKYNLDQLIADGYVKKITTFQSSNNLTTPGTTQSCEFIGVDGNQYLFFIADPIYTHIDSGNEIIVTNTYLSSIDNSTPLTTTTYSVITLSNFKVSGAYNDLNNQNFNISTTQSYSTFYPITNATYSIKLGNGNNVIPGSVTSVTTVNSLAGNGRFNSGIWENGVWNNGWREDLTRRDFYKIDQFYSYEKDKKWRVKISGSATQSFIIGDKVSISNIVAIDINEERKLLKKYYTIADIGSNYVEVEFENDFPLRRIEMDSDEHRIYISKNVWLSGVFLNGYFKGIWNSGLFSGYPLITKMDDSHWIDGTFNGGHFTSNKYGTTFSSVFPSDLNGVTRLGLSFSTPHNLAVDDIISVTPNTYFVSGVSKNNSLGTTIVSEVINDYQLTTGISWKTDYIDITFGGKINSIISSGLIQNFDFYSNNVSSITSLQSLRSERVFSYNSWIDVNYSNQSAVNIGKPQSILEGDTKRSYSENNLYGYPTNDVLSSNSVFRDSFSTSLRKYKLGKKWKIFNDYIGDSSSFEEYFDSSDTVGGIDAFNTQGWDISVNSDNNIKLTADSISYPIVIPASGYIGSTSSMTMSFYSDLTYILPTTGTIEGFMNTKEISVLIYNGQFLASKSMESYTGYTSLVSSKYTSDATIKNITYDILTNKTSFLLETTLPVSTISPKSGLDIYLTYLDKVSKTYLNLSFINGLTFSRTPEPLNNNSLTIGKELKVSTFNKGGYLNLIPSYDVLNRTNGADTQTLEKSRYTLIEFDLVDYISATNSYIESSTGYRQPSIHFNNLNYITRNVINGSATQSLILPATYLPINKNINHLLTRSKKKQEFFFNKRNLLMNFKGTGLAGSNETEYYLDNIKLYQINMIPFFQYFISPIGTQGNINRSVQIPITGTSPIIDYTEDNIIDSNNDNNDIITFFSNSLIASNIEIPAGINWERDYSIYRTQISGNDILGNDDLYLEN